MNDQRIINTGCTITVRHTDESLEAHVELDHDLLPETGDRVTVFGDPVRVEYGESVTLRRDAELVRATIFGKFWVKFKSLFEVTELYEVSFSPRRFR